MKTSSFPIDMEYTDYKNWYCVMVASGCENKARADLLARKAVVEDRFITDVSVPETSELVFSKSGKRRVRKMKLLPGYILVRVNKEVIEEEDGTVTKCFPAFTQKTIRDTFNVLGFAGANKNKPRMMKPSEIKSLFDRVDATNIDVTQNVTIDYNVGDVLDVIAGPFYGYKAEVTNIQGSKILAVIDMFDRSVPAEFTTHQLYKS